MRNQYPETELQTIIIQENYDRDAFRLFLQVCHGSPCDEILSVADHGTIRALLGLLHFYHVVDAVTHTVASCAIDRLAEPGVVVSMYGTAGLYGHKLLRQAALKQLIENSNEVLAMSELGSWSSDDVLDFLTSLECEGEDERAVYRFINTWFGCATRDEGIIPNDKLQDMFRLGVRWSCMPIHHLLQVARDGIVSPSTLSPHIVNPGSGQRRLNPTAVRVTGVSECGKKYTWPVPLEQLDSGRLAPLSPSCRLSVASPSLFWHFWTPVAPLSLACRFPVALLLLSFRSPVASMSLSCRPPVAILSLLFASGCFLSPCYFLPSAFLSLSCRPPVGPSCRSPVATSCCLPVALLSLACPLPVASLSPPYRLPVASLSPPCRLPVGQRGNLSLSCRLPIACLSLAYRLSVAFFCLPVASLVASLSPNVLRCRSPIALLWLACRSPLGCLSPTCRFPFAFVSPACRLFGASWCEEKRNLVPVETFPFCLVFHHLVGLKHIHYCCLTL